MIITRSVTKERIGNMPLTTLTKSVIKKGFHKKHERNVSKNNYNDNFLRSVIICDIGDDPLSLITGMTLTNGISEGH